MEIVSVQFQSKKNKEEYGGREYSYHAAIPLKVGDIVAVPTKHGTGTAKVTKLNVALGNVGCDIKLLKRIESLAEVMAPEESQHAITDTADCVQQPEF